MRTTPKAYLALLLAVSATWIASTKTFAANGADTWVGNTSALFSGANWTGANNPPISGDSLVFGAAGSSGTSLTADQTAAISYAGITFNSGASAFTIGGANGITLTGNVANNGTSLETLNFPIAATVVRTFTTTAGGGDIMLGGIFSGTGGGITKAGAGTLTLSGANTYTGATTVSGGTLVLTGNGSISSTASQFQIGTINGTPAAVYQSGASTYATAQATGGAWQLGNTAGASGYYNLSAGTLTIQNGGELDPAGSSGGTGTYGQFDMSGGIVNVGVSGTGATYFLPCRGGAGESSVVNLSGGTFTVLNGMTDGQYGGYEANWNAGGQTNVTTISGSALFQSLTESVKLNWKNDPGNVGILNLDGGTWQMRGLHNSYDLNVRVNFNGGTVKAGSVANTTFLGNSAAACVFAGGGTVDNNGQTITITQPIVPSAGNGIATIPVSSGGAGYIIPPQVIISDATGSNATAYAQISSGAVTGIVVTCPGNNYSATPTVALVGGGYTTAATIGTVTTTANVSGGLTFQGSGTTTLSGANTYSGGTTLNAGTLSLGNTCALGTGTLTISGGNLDCSALGLVNANNNAQSWNSDFTFVGSQSLNLGTGAVTPNASRQVTVTANTLTVGGAIGGGAISLTKAGAGTLALSGANTYSGATTINAGALIGIVGGSCANSAVSVAATSGNTAKLGVSIGDNTKQWTCAGLTVNNAGTSSSLDFNYSVTPSTTLAPLSVSGNITFTTLPTINVEGGANLSVTSGNGYPLITWTGTGPSSVSGITLTMASHVTGNLAIVGNTLYLQITANKEPVKWVTSSGTWDTSTSNWKDNASTTTTYSDGDSVVFDDNPGATTTVTLNSTVNPYSVTNNNSTYAYTISGSGAIVGSGSLTKSGTQSLTLSTSNSYSGGTTINGGILNAGTNTALGTGPVTLNGGTLRNGATSVGTIANNIVVGSSGGTITIGASGNLTLTGTLSGAGNLTIGGSGTANASIYLQLAGNTMTSGTITLVGSTSGIARTKTTAATSAAVDYVISGNTPDTEAGGTYNFGSLSGSGNLNANTGNTVYSIGGNNNSKTYSGAFSQTSVTLSILKVGTGAETFSGASSYTGATTVENGSLVAGANVSLSTAGPFGTTSSAIALGDATTISSAAAMNPQLLIGGAFTIALPITVGANNNALGNASTTFTIGGNTANSSTFSGAITLNQNLIVSQVASGTLNISGNMTSGASGTQTITVNDSGPVNIGTGVIGGGTGTIALTKTGAGTLTLSAANTYAGNTTVSGGTLLVNGSIVSGSAVSVSGSSSILGGSGTINGATTISSSGSLTPRPSGGSATATTFGGNLTLSSASANFTLATTVAGASDNVVYGNSGGGTLTLDSSDTINVTCTSLQQADYTLFSTTSGTLSMSSVPTLKTNGVTVTPAVGSFIITNSGNNVVLHYLQASTPATVTAQTASPSSIGHHGTTLITVSATPAGGDSISSVTVASDGLAGAGDPASLVSDGNGNWTNTFTASASLALGSYIVSGSVIENSGAIAPWTVTVNVVNTNSTWNGGGADNKWSTANNWNSGLNPGPGDNIFFSGTTQTTNNLDASLSVGALTFNANAGNFDITNSTLTLTGGLTNNSVNTQTLDVPVALSGAQTINAAAGNVTINRAVSDSGAGLTLVGSGTLTLSATNTYSGATTISGGILAVTGTGLLGNGSYSAGITDNGSLSYSSSSAQTLSGIISGAGLLTNSGNGTLTLSAANTYSGGTTLRAGTLLVQGNSTPTSGTVTSGPLGTGTLTLNGGTFGFTGASGYTIANNVSVGAAANIETASAQNELLNGNWSGSGNLTLMQNGTTATWQFGGDNSGYTGTLTQNSGNTSLAFNNASAGSASAAWVFNNNVNQRTRLNFGAGTISFGSLSGNGSVANIAASGTATVSVGALNTSTTFAGTLGGTSTGQAQNINLLKVGTGALTLSAVNNHTGTTTISAGEVIGQTGGSCASSAVTVAVGATNGVKITAANGQWSCASLTYSAGDTNYSDFDFGTAAPSTTTAPLSIGGNLNTNGTVQIIVRNGSGFTAGAVYPLMAWTGTGPGNLATFATPILPAGTIGTLTLGSQSISLNAGIYVPNLFFTNAPGIARIITTNDLIAAGLASSQGSPNYTITVGTPVNGGAAFTNSSGTMIKYTNSPSFAGSSDSFTYTVSDGTSSASATVNITMASATGPQLATSGTDGNGHAVINFNAIPNYTYHMQHATTLSPPDWTNLLNTITVPANGAVTWTNFESPAAGFYRLSYP